LHWPPSTPPQEGRWLLLCPQRDTGDHSPPLRSSGSALSLCSPRRLRKAPSPSRPNSQPGKSEGPAACLQDSRAPALLVADFLPCTVEMWVSICSPGPGPEPVEGKTPGPGCLARPQPTAAALPGPMAQGSPAVWKTTPHPAQPREAQDTAVLPEPFRYPL
jgi:hypothetical protein